MSIETNSWSTQTRNKIMEKFHHDENKQHKNFLQRWVEIFARWKAKNNIVDTVGMDHKWQQHILVPTEIGGKTQKNATWRPPKHTHKHAHVIDFFLRQFSNSKVVQTLQNPNAPQYWWSAIAQIVMSLGGQRKGPCQKLLEKELWEIIENSHHGMSSHQEFFFLWK